MLNVTLEPTGFRFSDKLNRTLFRMPTVTTDTNVLPIMKSYHVAVEDITAALSVGDVSAIAQVVTLFCEEFDRSDITVCVAVLDNGVEYETIFTFHASISSTLTVEMKSTTPSLYAVVNDTADNVANEMLKFYRKVIGA